MFEFFGPGLPPGSLLMLMGLLAASGAMSGLAGFGFSAIGAASLWILPPTQAVPLLMALSTANQLLSMYCLKQWTQLSLHDWRRGPLPYMAGGLVGLKPGLWILVEAPIALFTAAMGAVLVGYTLWNWLAPRQRSHRPGGPVSALLVGLVGGVVGGFSAFPGAAVVIWTGWRGMPKEQVRALVQPYILTMQVAALALLAATHPAAFDRRFFVLLALTLPVVLPLTITGVWLYRRTGDTHFKRIALLLLAASGLGLLGRSLGAFA